MKTKKSDTLREAPVAAYVAQAPMVRTQIYLSKAEHDFLSIEAARRNGTMASVIRELIDEKMDVPDDSWCANPLLEETPQVEGFGHRDGARNHDNYIYGRSKSAS